MMELPTLTPGSAIAEVERMLVDSALRGGRIFSSAKLPQTPVTGQPVEDRIGVLNLVPYLTECSGQGCSLSIADLGSLILIHGNRTKTGWVDEHKLRKEVKNLAQVVFYRQSQSSPIFLSLLQSAPEKRKQLMSFLHSRRRMTVERAPHIGTLHMPLSALARLEQAFDRSDKENPK